MRAEILYHNGGIYMDFKTEIRRSLDPWLKYKIYFNDLDYINYG